MPGAGTCDNPSVRGAAQGRAAEARLERAGADRYESFVREYGGKAFCIAYHLEGNVEEAKDLVQDAFCRLLKSWDRYDASRPLEGWFATILRNIFLDGRKRYDRRHVCSLDRAPEPSGEDGQEEPSRGADALPDGSEPFLDALSRRETVEAVRKALKRLSCEHRAVLALCDAQGQGYESIARTLGVPVGTVRSRLSRARIALRKELVRLEEVEG